MHLYGTIAKVDAEQRVVAGYASTENVDSQGEVILLSALESALDDYLEFPTVRQMHQLDAVGKTVEATIDEKGLYISAKIVDDMAWKKVTTGVFRGFSVGGKVLSRDPDNRKIITKVRLDEISLVDRPSNSEARIDVWKAAGAPTKGDAAMAGTTNDDRDAALARINGRLTSLTKSIPALVRENERLTAENARLRAAAAAPKVERGDPMAKVSALFKEMEESIAKYHNSLRSFGQPHGGWN
jgi:HK97 family phage prohead protease